MFSKPGNRLKSTIGEVDKGALFCIELIAKLLDEAKVERKIEVEAILAEASTKRVGA